MSETWLVVGLGNPGPDYHHTRHNAGQMVLDILAERMGARFSPNTRARAAVAAGRLSPGGPKVILAKPLTYMNLSGGPTKALAAYFSIPLDHIVVIHDEVDIPFDTLKLKRGGGEGGHNGLRDISKAMGSKDYLRVRVGVGRPPGQQNTADYVLRPFSKAESKDLPLHLDRAADAVEELITHGLALTQTKFH